jgi:predicted TIM-barrel fold metal-dependent hydrolase
VTRRRTKGAQAEPVPIRPGSRLAAECWAQGRSDTCPVYDMHGHMGPWKSIYFPAAGADAMVRLMDAAGVKLLCFTHHAALFSPDQSNAPSVAAVRQYPDRLRAYLGINPHYPEIIRRELAGFDRMRDVFVGLKLLAAYHRVRMSDRRYRYALAFAAERRLPVLVHTWSGDPACGAAEVRRVAERYPAVTFLLGHCLNDDWEAAVAVAKEFPNTYLELTSIPGKRGVVEQLVEGAGSGRILFGTDLPWFEEHQGIGSLLSADITEADIHNILHRNAERILKTTGARLSFA